MEEKDKFWTDLDEVVERITKEESVVIGADFNGHVGEGNRGDGGFRDKNGNGCVEHIFQKEGGAQGDV